MSDRRTQILDAASTLIAERGYSQTSIDDVIQQSRLCGKSHFYHYFRSKEELGLAVLDRQFECFAEVRLALLREPMRPPLERLNAFIDSVVSSRAECGCRGGSPIGSLASELADAHEGFRLRIGVVLDRWAEQLHALLWELGPRLREGAEPARIARFIIASLEGGMLMARVTRDISALEGIAVDLKQYVASNLREEAVVR
jgi:TetR/AcrR family transcriptional repressor of nem operon